jgi:hypothetical protein
MAILGLLPYLSVELLPDHPLNRASLSERPSSVFHLGQYPSAYISDNTSCAFP